MAYTEFYLDPAASGASDTNGGGSTSAPTSYTVNTDGAGTTVTSTSGNIGALAAGTWVYIDNNGTAAWRRVTSPNGSNQITVSPALTGSMNGRAAKSGGSFLTYRGACNALASIGSANWPSPDVATPPRLNVQKDGSYVETAAIATHGAWGGNPVSGTVIFLTVEPYTSTAGDLGGTNGINHSTTNTTRATVTTSSNVSLFTTFGTGVLANSMIYSNTYSGANNRYVVLSAAANMGQCKLTNCGFIRSPGSGANNNEAIQFGATQSPYFLRCYFSKTVTGSGACVTLNGANCNPTFEGCEFVNSGNSGSDGVCADQTSATTGGGTYIRCIFRNGNIGFKAGTGAVLNYCPTRITGCGFYALQTGVQATTQAGAESTIVSNCAWDTVVTCINNTSGTSTRMVHEDFNACLTGRTTFVSTAILNAGPNNLDAVAAVFAGAGSNNFALDSASTLNGAGYPGYLYAGTTGYRGFASIGPLPPSGAGAAVTGTGDASVPFPVYGAQYRVSFSLVNTAGVLQSGATIGNSGKAKLVRDGTAANSGGSVTEWAASSGIYYVDLTAAEMASNVIKVIVTATGCTDSITEVRPVQLPLLTSGTSTAGSASGLTLQNTAVATDGYYAGCVVVCKNQARLVNTQTGLDITVTSNFNAGSVPSTDTYSIYLNTIGGISSGNVTSWGGGALPTLPTVVGGQVGVYTVGTDAITSTSFQNGAIGSVSDITGGTVTALQAAQPNGYVTGATSATSFTVNGLNSSQVNNWAGSYLLFTGGALSGQIKKITASTAVSAGNTTLTTDAFTATPVVNAATTYRIINGTV